MVLLGLLFFKPTTKTLNRIKPNLNQLQHIKPDQENPPTLKKKKKSLLSKLIFFDNLLIILFPSHWFFFTYFQQNLEIRPLIGQCINSIFSNLSSSFTNLWERSRIKSDSNSKRLDKTQKFVTMPEILRWSFSRWRRLWWRRWRLIGYTRRWRWSNYLRDWHGGREHGGDCGNVWMCSRCGEMEKKKRMMMMKKMMETRLSNNDGGCSILEDDGNNQTNLSS